MIFSGEYVSLRGIGDAGACRGVSDKFWEKVSPLIEGGTLSGASSRIILSADGINEEDGPPELLLRVTEERFPVLHASITYNSGSAEQVVQSIEREFEFVRLTGIDRSFYP